MFFSGNVKIQDGFYRQLGRQLETFRLTTERQRRFPKRYSNICLGKSAH